MIYQLKLSYTTANSGATTGATAVVLGQLLFLGLICGSDFTVVGFGFGF
jgi:hypothetical protein